MTSTSTSTSLTGCSLNRNPLWSSCIGLFVALYFFIHPFFPQKQIYAWFISQFQSERSIYIYGTIIVHTTIFILGNLVMQICYFIKHPFLEQYKIQKNKVWPWERNAEEAAEYRTLIYKSIGIFLFNNFIISPFLLSSNFYIVKMRGIQFSQDTIPEWYVATAQLCAFLIIEDTLFYWCHRLFHHRLIYRYIHKYHHQYHTVIGIASEHAHPIEFIFSNGIPFFAGPLLFGCHMAVFWQWVLLRIAEAIEAHCGYDFPWSPFRFLPFSGSAAVHDFHHSHNVGNFSGFFTWWDHAMGTDVAWLAHEAKLIHEAQARAQAATPNTTVTKDDADTVTSTDTNEIENHIKAQ